MTITIQGQNIQDIPSFYNELNRVFMQDEDWKLGNSLDGFNDLLHGGFGVLKNQKDVTIIWQDIETSKTLLGYHATKEYYLQKLSPDSPFDKKHFRDKLHALEEGNGQTYFDIIMEIIDGHPNIHLIV